MSFRYANKLMHTIISLGNFKQTAYFTFRHALSLNRISHFTKLDNISYYSSVPISSSGISTLPRYIKDAVKFTTTDISSILATESIDHFTQEQRILLLQCCGKLVPNKPLRVRIQLLKKIFEKFQRINLNVDDYNMYIKVNTENEVLINSADFLKNLKCEPNEETYKLLLENVCEKGDTHQAYEILSKIKENHYTADERVFNSLILCYTIADGHEGAKVVLNTMKAAQIVESSDTNWNILRGLAIRNESEGFMAAIEKLSVEFNEEHFLKLVLILALSDNEEMIKILRNKCGVKVWPKRLISAVEHLCIHLIHRNKPDIAIRIYSDFAGQDVDDEHYKYLLKEILETEADTDQILNICRYLEATREGVQALFLVTGIALRKNQTDRAWMLLKRFDKLRSHYFWPILLKAGKEKGEIGVISILKEILDMNVEIDSETFETYILPFCDLSCPRAFRSRISHLNLSLRQLLTPILGILLRNSQVKEAVELYEEHKTALDGGKLIRPLAIAWKNAKDVGIVDILKAICETNDMSSIDFTGRVLIQCLNLCKSEEDYSHFLTLTKVLHTERLNITPTNSEAIEAILERRENVPLRKEIEDALYNLLDVSMNKDELSIAHPRNMSLDELECHLIELINKNMEVRGVLRRLIQTHSRLGNHGRVHELRKMLEESGLEESAGMKASLMQTYINTRQCQMAVDFYRELREKFPDFKVDEYKLIDLAALLVDDGKYEVAVEILEYEFRNRNARGGKPIERNCINLLNAAKTPEQAIFLFEFLTTRNFCTPRNIILGPVLRSYLKRGDLGNGVKFYGHCCRRYKCTPLQIELLQALVDAKNEELLKRTLDATTSVYGSLKARVSLVVVLVDKGLKKALTKLLLDLKHVPDVELQNRCDKWVKDGKLESLLTLADVGARIPQQVVNVDIVHTAIVKFYDTANDVEGAQRFLNRMIDNDVTVSQTVIDYMHSLAKRNKVQPSDRIGLIR